MWARSFWDEHQGDGSPHSKAVAETNLAFLVHDEIKWSTFADVIDAATHDWLQALPDEVLNALATRQTDKFESAIEKYVEAVGWPNGDAEALTDIQRYLGIGDWAEVITSDTNEYLVREDRDPDEDIYARNHGNRWHARPRNWWQNGANQIADRILFLTTETVPTAVAEKAHPGIYVVELNADRMPRDSIETEIARGVNSQKLEILCALRLRELKVETGMPWSAVSNKAPLQGVITHAKARGANGLIGRNVLQTCTYAAPADYDLHQALNAWTGRRDLVSWRHIDEINQSAGRNLGFRHQDNVRHILLINRRLYQTLIITGAFSGLRYDLVVKSDNDQRKNATKKA